MEIINRNNSKRIRLADSYFKRLKGLMFIKDIDYGLLIETSISSDIHTCFMRFPVDVYFIKDSLIFDKATLNPWSFYKPCKKADFVLEFKKDDFKIRKEDEILIIRNNQEYLKASRK